MSYRNPADKKAHAVRRNRKHRDILAQHKCVPCADCGRLYPSYVMDFDHRDPATKLFHVGSCNRRLETILAEIEKCDVVCANCHRERTWGNGRISRDRTAS